MENIINDKDFVMYCVFHKNFHEKFPNNSN